jgi:hypothetical protein
MRIAAGPIFSGKRLAATAAVAALVAAAFGAPSAGARSLAVASPVAQVSFDDTGAYRVRCRHSPWLLEGKLGARPDSLDSRSGADRLGAWREVRARTGVEVAVIRVYENQPVVLFREERLQSGGNVGAFPRFAALPSGLMKLGYAVDTFAPYEFGKLGAQGPWVLFDKERRTMVLSPADHFLAAAMSDAPGRVAAGGIDSSIATLPAGFHHATLLVLGRGITRTLNAWGDALQVLGGKKPVSSEADVLLRKFGYWTDNGAAYYYHFVPSLGYEGTLLAVRDAYRKLGVTPAYMELDSWWYPKEQGNSLAAMAVNGETVYRANRKVFPHGLRAFHRQLGLPFVVHARWVAEDSPYRREYRMSRNVVLSPAFWSSTAKYLRDSGVAVYEQDWLNENARPAINLTDPGQFLGNMAHGLGKEGVAVQYCMELPGYLLASTRYQDVEAARVAGDRFEPSKWDEFLYGSALAHAVGLWPWSDVFMSGDLPELVLSTLSAGPVGVGDALGHIDAANLKRAMRADAVLLKPDVPAEPVDASFLAEAQNSKSPMVAATHSGDEVEVFAYPRAPGAKEVTVSLREVGISGPAYEWDWVRREGRRIAAGGSFPMVFQDGWAYAVVTPIGKDHLGLLGDTGKIVPLASERFPTVTNVRYARVAVAYAAGEHAVTLAGYAANRPTVRAIRGSVDALRYDEATHLFRVTVHPARGAARSAELVISD